MHVAPLRIPSCNARYPPGSDRHPPVDILRLTSASRPGTCAVSRAYALEHKTHCRAATKRPDISICLGAHGAIFSSAPSLPPDVPRTPGMRQAESQPGLSRGHPSLGHTRTASRPRACVGPEGSGQRAEDLPTSRPARQAIASPHSKDSF